MTDHLQTAVKSIEKQIAKLQLAQSKALEIIADQKSKVDALQKQIDGLRQVQKSVLEPNENGQ